MTRIKVFVTKTLKFRAMIKDNNKPEYEVTVGGEEWKRGLGREHEEHIRKKINFVMDALHAEIFCVFDNRDERSLLEILSE